MSLETKRSRAATRAVADLLADNVDLSNLDDEEREALRSGLSALLAALD